MTTTPDSAKDRVTVGVSPEGESCLELLVSRGWFETDVVAFRVAVAYALAADLQPVPGAKFSTKWNAGSLDQDGRLQDLVRLFSQTSQPVELAQSLGDAGLRRITERVQNHESIGDVLSSPS